MSDPFDLPERDLPDHVRQLALLRVMDGIARELPRRKTGLAPLLIAASVIALMAGATIVTSTLNTKDSKPLNASPASPPPSTTTSGAPYSGYYLYGAQRYWGTGADMERCSAANHIQSTWSPLLQVKRNGLTVLLYRIGNEIVLCELAKETVTVETLPYPNPPTGSTPATVLFATQDGTYAGVTAPGVSNLVVASGSADKGEPAAVGDGVFILPNSFAPTDTLWLRNDSTGYPGYPVPKADVPQALPPTTVAHDPKADRTSAAGQRVGTCATAGADRPLPDPDYWEPGAFLPVGDTQWVQLATLNDALLVCRRTGVDQFQVDGAAFDDGAAIGAGGFSKVMTTSIGNNALYVGLISKSGAKTVAVDPPGAAELTGTVDKGTVAVLYPDPHGPISGSVIKVKDAAGNVIDQLSIN